MNSIDIVAVIAIGLVALTIGWDMAMIIVAIALILFGFSISLGELIIIISDWFQQK